MKNVFVDIYLAFNFGDDLFLDILAGKFPNTDFTVNHLGKNYDGFLSQYHNVKRRKYTILHKVGQRLKVADFITNYHKAAEEHDALVFIGGSIFREEEFHDSLYQERLTMVKEFKKRKKPVYILGANFGPYKTEKFLDDYRKFFELADDVCFRDVHSYDLFHELSQIRYAPDIVFQMNADQYKDASRNNTVGFSIIDVHHKQGLAKYDEVYLHSTVKSIEYFVSKGYDCCLMSFCEEEGDLQIINKIQSLLPANVKSHVSIYNYQGNIYEAIRLFSTFALFIAARFHANILALLLDIGVVPVIYSEKTTNMLKDLNLDDILVKMDELHLLYDEKMINQSFHNKTSLEGHAKEAEKQFEILRKFLEA